MKNVGPIGSAVLTLDTSRQTDKQDLKLWNKLNNEVFQKTFHDCWNPSVLRFLNWFSNYNLKWKFWFEVKIFVCVSESSTDYTETTIDDTIVESVLELFKIIILQLCNFETGAFIRYRRSLTICQFNAVFVLNAFKLLLIFSVLKKYFERS